PGRRAQRHGQAPAHRPSRPTAGGRRRHRLPRLRPRELPARLHARRRRRLHRPIAARPVPRRTMTSVFCFAEDLLGEGVPTVLDHLGETGADSVTLAATYHQARDVFPHHPDGALRYLPSGSCAFQPDPRRYGLLAPEPGPGGQDPLAELVEAASARGLTTAAWTVVLHNSRLGHAHPEVTVRNALGDRLRHALCP